MKKLIKNSLLWLTCLLFLVTGCQGPGKKEKKPLKSAQNSEHAVNKPDYIFGKVKETMDGGGYTYMLLEFDGKDTWVAVPKMEVKTGEEIMLYPGQVMKNFHSKSLNRTFSSIVFSQGPVAPPSSEAKGGEPAQMAIQAHSSRKTGKREVNIDHAKGPGAITVAEAYEKAKELSGKKVVLKAIVVKVSKNILGKNWIHCQDGTGSEAKNNYDLTVTTKSLPAVGDAVVVKGTLTKDKDIGAGYFYPVIIEDAEVTVIKK